MSDRAELREGLMLAVSRSPAIDGGRLEDVWDLVLRAAVEGLGVQRAGVWMLGEGRASICCVALLDRRAGAVMHEPVTLTREAYPRYFEALDSERAILAYDALNDPRTAEFRAGYLEPKGIRAMLDVPVRFHGEMVGIICCEQAGAKREWQAEEGCFAAMLAAMIGRTMTAQAMARSELALRELNASLERRVSERTAQLQQTLDHLTQTRDQLIEREKLAVIGDLSSKVAHDVNTPLGNAVTASSTLQERLNELSAAFAGGRLTRSSFAEFTTHADEALGLLVGNLNRAAHLVRDFMRIAVDQIGESRDQFVLADLLDALVTSLRPVTRQVAVAPVIDCPSDLVIDAYPGVLGQIITNLVVNSCRHAFAGVERPQIRILVTVHGDWVKLRYVDNGCGIPQALHQRVFEPFFTTRRGEGGSGLGLSIVSNLVTARLGGKLTLSSRPGEGVQFDIEFRRELPPAS